MSRTRPNLCGFCEDLHFGSIYESTSVIDISAGKHPGLSSISALQQLATTCDCCAFFCRQIKDAITLAKYSSQKITGTPSFFTNLESLPLVLRAESRRMRIESYERAEAYRSLSLRFENKSEDKSEDKPEDKIIAPMRLATTRESVLDPVFVGPTDVRPPTVFRCNAVPEILSSEDIGNMVRNWYDQCSTKHAKCSKSSTKSIPKRVLDVGTADKPRLRLVENNNHLCGDYIALSYCWGTKPQTCTYRHNIEDFKLAIAESELPSTVKDAINITRALRVPFLWIDAFCIIQKDATDWNEQSSKMQEVYSESYLTLCASNASSVHDGVFHSRQNTTLEVDSVLEDGAQRSVYLIPDVGNPSSLQHFTDLTPLGARGWCLQERLLPCRKVYLHKQQMIWECSERFFFESGIRAGIVATISLEMPVVKQGINNELNFAKWEQLVQSYTACQLTNMTDRLPAIGGIAAHFSKSLKARALSLTSEEVEDDDRVDEAGEVDDDDYGSFFDFAEKIEKETVGSAEYVAGHWKDNLVPSLLWRVLGSRLPVSSSGYGAPSWSWASAPGQVKFKEGFNKHDNFQRWDNLTYHAEPSRENPWGSVPDAWVSFSAPLLEVTYDENVTEPALGINISGDEHRLVPDQDHPVLDSGIYLDRGAVSTKLFAVILYTNHKPRSYQIRPTEGWDGLFVSSSDASTYKRAGSFWRCKFRWRGLRTQVEEDIDLDFWTKSIKIV